MRRLLALVIAGAALLGAVPAGAAPRPNVIIGTYGNDRLAGTKHPDRILGLSGDDRLYGGGSSDRLVGGFGNDVLRDASTGGRPQIDVFRGGPGFDRCIGNAVDRFYRCEVVRIR